MINDIENAITELNETINDTQNKIAILKSIDFTKPVTEDQWHMICETPLRSSDLLVVLVKNTFPLAENIFVHYNYVYFEMLGFNVQIPTSCCRGVNVDTSWYKKDDGEPTRIYSDSVQNMIDYFDAVDNKKGWYECAKCRLTYGKTYRKWFLFFVWWFKYKWKDPKRKQFEETKSQQEQKYRKRVERYQSQRQDIKNKAYRLLNELMPILDKFSTIHSRYNDQWSYSIYSIEEIREYEN